MPAVEPCAQKKVCRGSYITKSREGCLWSRCGDLLVPPVDHASLSDGDAYALAVFWSGKGVDGNVGLNHSLLQAMLRGDDR